VTNDSTETPEAVTAEFHEFLNDAAASYGVLTCGLGFMRGKVEEFAELTNMGPDGVWHMVTGDVLPTERPSDAFGVWTRRRIAESCGPDGAVVRATRGPGCGTVCACVREREARIVRSRPPASSPLTRPDPSGPSAHRSLGSDRHCGKRVTSGGAGWIGSKRLDPGAPATPRPGYRRQVSGLPKVDTRLPLSPFFTQSAPFLHDTILCSYDGAGDRLLGRGA
jgi:hypothetical protein